MYDSGLDGKRCPFWWLTVHHIDGRHIEGECEMVGYPCAPIVGTISSPDSLTPLATIVWKEEEEEAAEEAEEEGDC